MLQAEWVDGSTELAHWHRTMTWYGPVPFGFATSGEDYMMHFLTPLHAAFSGRRLDIDVFTCEGDFCAAHGTFVGTQDGPWLGYRASGKELSMDFGMHWRVDTEARQILEGWAIFDLPRMFLGLGVDLLNNGGGGAFRAEQDSAAAAAGDKKGALGVPPADNNQCANRYAHPPAGSQTLDCPDFVIRSTDATWHPRDWDATSRAVDTYFSDDWQSVRAFGMMIRGREALRDFMKDWLGGFPDVFIHVADVFCEGTDEVGYKTTMPYVLTATHSGHTKAFGAPTGRKVKYHGIANCYIKQNAAGQWQYTREWDLPDMWSFITALNLTASQLPHPKVDQVPVDDCKPLLDWKSGEMNWFPPIEPALARWGA